MCSQYFNFRMKLGIILPSSIQIVNAEFYNMTLSMYLIEYKLSVHNLKTDCWLISD